MTDLGNFGERQDAGTKDWGFFAHLSIYAFAAGFSSGKHCLDLGCGTGYGADHLRRAGAASVLALDKDAGVVEVLARRYPEVMFRAVDVDLSALPTPDASIDLFFSSNVFEHIAYVDPLLAECTRVLRPEGLAVIAVPPVVTPEMLSAHAKNVFHINNIPPWAWQAKLGRYFGAVTYYRHWVTPGRETADGLPNFQAGGPEDFLFEAGDIRQVRTITSVFVCHEPRAVLLAGTGGEDCPAEWRPRKIEAQARQDAFVELNRQREEDLGWWRKEMASLAAWVEQARAQGTDPASIVDAVARQLAHYRGD